MAMINYADKVALNSNSGIADINKCNATDMNELKSAFNNQVAFGWYKTGISPTFTFVSYDSTTYTGVVNSNLDLTSYLSVGMKVKFTQSSTIKYAFITAITSTQLTLFLGTDYSLNNSAISNSYYSMLKTPYGFPINPDKWSFKLSDTRNLIQSNPIKNTWYNPGSLSLSIPIGLWNVSFYVNAYPQRGTTGFTTQQTALSTSNNSASDQELRTTLFVYNAVADISRLGAGVSKNKIISLTNKTTYYLIALADQENLTAIAFRGDFGATEINAVCAYL